MTIWQRRKSNNINSAKTNTDPFVTVTIIDLHRDTIRTRMPPKRKNAETAMGDKQSSAKTAKTATTTAAGGAAKEKKHKPKPAKAEKTIKAQTKATAADLEAKASS